MNPNRFFMPGMGPDLSVNPMMGANHFIYRNGIFSKIFNNIKSFNWNGFLSGANKTLNVVNQTIPLIRQTKPMVSNIRNMVHLAKVFRSETSRNSLSNVKNKNTEKEVSNSFRQKKEVIDNSNYPNFFI